MAPHAFRTEFLLGRMYLIGQRSAKVHDVGASDCSGVLVAIGIWPLSLHLVVIA